MEVVKACSSQLSNREALDLLKRNIKNASAKKQTNLATILYETTSYLESSPAASYTQENWINFHNILVENKYDLSELELIQLANLKPQNEMELHLIIDNIEEKLTGEQRAELLKLIQSHLTSPNEPQEPATKKMKI